MSPHEDELADSLASPAEELADAGEAVVEVDVAEGTAMPAAERRRAFSV